MLYLKRRNIFIMLILLGNLKGLYLSYWIASTQNAIRKIENKRRNGFLIVIYIVLTFGIYNLFWQWKICNT